MVGSGPPDTTRPYRSHCPAPAPPPADRRRMGGKTAGLRRPPICWVQRIRLPAALATATTPGGAVNAGCGYPESSTRAETWASTADGGKQRSSARNDRVATDSANQNRRRPVRETSINHAKPLTGCAQFHGRRRHRAMPWRFSPETVRFPIMVHIVPDTAVPAGWSVPLRSSAPASGSIRRRRRCGED